MELLWIRERNTKSRFASSENMKKNAYINAVSVDDALPVWLSVHGSCVLLFMSLSLLSPSWQLLEMALHFRSSGSL